MKKSFIIDLIATIPVETLAYIITGSSDPKLKLFSGLKLIRVSRLTRIIARLNIHSILKNWLNIC